MKLEIELIPQTTFFTNVRSLVSGKEWDDIRRKVYRAAKYKCEICGGKGDRWPVECHEVWDYDFSSEIQKLVRLIALCPSCHEVKHLGLAQLKGRYDEALEHFKKVNSLSDAEAEVKVSEAFDEWRNKNKIEWNLDISELESYK